MTDKFLTVQPLNLLSSSSKTPAFSSSKLPDTHIFKTTPCSFYNNFYICCPYLESVRQAILYIWMTITLASVFVPQANAISGVENGATELFDKNTPSDDKDDSDDKQVTLQIDRTVGTTLQPGFHADLASEFELPVVIDSVPKRTKLTTKEVNNPFKILFYFTISPNAP